jgi:hypothetical protein
MRHYRLLMLDKKGLMVGSASIECVEDREAIAIAEKKLGRCAYIEIWNGGRPVCICAAPLRSRFSLAASFRSVARAVGRFGWWRRTHRWAHQLRSDVLRGVDKPDPASDAAKQDEA